MGSSRTIHQANLERRRQSLRLSTASSRLLEAVICRGSVVHISHRSSTCSDVGATHSWRTTCGKRPNSKTEIIGGKSLLLSPYGANGDTILNRLTPGRPRCPLAAILSGICLCTTVGQRGNMEFIAVSFPCQNCKSPRQALEAAVLGWRHSLLIVISTATYSAAACRNPRIAEYDRSEGLIRRSGTFWGIGQGESMAAGMLCHRRRRLPFPSGENDEDRCRSPVDFTSSRRVFPTQSRW